MARHLRQNLILDGTERIRPEGVPDTVSPGVDMGRDCWARS